MGIAWNYTNQEEDVEVAIVGTDEMQFVLTIWHPLAGSSRAFLTVDRDQADIKGNQIADIDFGSIEEAKTWAEQRFGWRKP